MSKHIRPIYRPRPRRLTRRDMALMILDEWLGFPDLDLLIRALLEGHGIFDSTGMDLRDRLNRAARLEQELPGRILSGLQNAVSSRL